MGGAIVLEAAIRHPELVRKLIFADGASYNPDAYYPQMMAMEKKMTGADLDGSPFKVAYTRVAPNSGNWNALFEKIKKMDIDWKGVPVSDVKSIKVQTLLMIGDADIVRPEHTVEMFRLLGGGVPGDIVGLPRSQLAVLPGSTDVTLMQRSEWLIPLVNAFLDALPPKPADVQRQ
ncbi:MAG: alpha/beta hydrolase [Gemmatimonadales bacterium]